MTRKQALRELREAEIAFLRAYGWKEKDGHWYHPKHGDGLFSHDAAVEAAKPEE